MEIFIAGIFIVVLFAAALLYSAFSWGFVTFKFWYWFILPIFPALPHVTFYQSVGLFLFINLFQVSTKKATKEPEKTDNENRGELIGTMLAPWLTLLIGYCIYLIII